MSVAVLTALALIQTAFVLLLIVTLLMARWFRPQASHLARARVDELARELFRFLAGRTDLEDVLDRIDRARLSTVLYALQDVAGHVVGEPWEDLIDGAREQMWFQSILSRSGSRFWWRRLDAALAFAVVARPRDEIRVLRLLGDPHPAVRLAAVPALRRVPSQTLVRAALDLADSGRTPIQHYVVETVSRLGGLNLASLRVRLEAGRDPLETRALLDLSARLGLPAFLPAVLDRLDDPDLEVRIGAVRALGRFPHPRVTAALIGALADPEWQIRAQAATALGVIGARDAARPLFRLLGDHSWWVRLRSGVALRLIGEPGIQMLEGVRPAHDPFAADMARYVLGLDGGALGEFAGGDVVGYATGAPARVA